MIERTNGCDLKAARLVLCCLLALACAGSFASARVPSGGESKPGAARRMCGTVMIGAGRGTGDYLSVAANETGEIPIVFYVLRDSLGLRGYDPGEGVSVEEGLAEAVEHLHTYFPESPDGLFRTFRFRIEAIFDGAVDEIFRSDRYITIEEAELDEIRQRYGVAGAINVFLVDELTYDAETWCGISSYPGNPAQGIVMDWKCLKYRGAETQVLAHEIGHYFYLYHPHETGFGIELVRRDPANCEWCGDKLCDTPADPGLSWDNVDTLTCVYIGDERDPEGTPYDPDPHNVMSYGPWACRQYFSIGQLARMTMAFEHGLPGTGSAPVPSVVAVRVYPNPMLPGSAPVTIDFFDMPESFALVHVGVYDAGGRLVRTIHDGHIDRLDTYGRFQWRGDDDRGRFVASGIYFIAVRLSPYDIQPRIGGAKIGVLK